MTINTGLTLKDIEVFLMILMRITSFMFIAPFFSIPNTPMRVKVGLSIFISMLIYMAVPLEMPEYSGLWEYAIIIVKESAVGLLIGFAAFIASVSVLFAGRMIDMEIGLSMSNMFDITTKTSASITGGLYNYLLIIMMVITDMHLFLLEAVADSFKLIPIGGIHVNGLYGPVMIFFSDYFAIGFRIVLPVFAVTLILNAILAILAKVSPQMNMFAVGIQLKVLVGLGTIFLLAGSLPAMADFIFSKMSMMVSQVIKGML